MGKKNTILLFIACVLLVVLAVAAGFYFSRGIAENITAEAEKRAFTPEADRETVEDGHYGKKSGMEADMSSEEVMYENGLDEAEDDGTSLSQMPVNIMFVNNPASGKLEHMVLEVLNCSEPVAAYIYIDPAISYTMSSDLFRKLANQNALLPQTVTFSRLYSYYDSEKAYDAGRRILAEMLGIEINYYTAFNIGDFMSAFSVIEEASDSGTLKKAVFHSENNRFFSNPEKSGQEEGSLEKALKNAVSNWKHETRKKYALVYEQLRESDIFCESAPVIRNNESCELDCSRTADIIWTKCRIGKKEQID